MTEQDCHLLSQAFGLACMLHATQRRKIDETPYLGHLLRVAGFVLQYGGTPTEAAAALLHDAVEDQGGRETLAKIEAEFGPQLAGIVAGCSDTAERPKPPWRQRKEAFLQRLRSASLSVRLVVAADKLDNLLDLLEHLQQSGNALWEHFRAGPEQTLWYYRQVTEELKRTARPDENCDDRRWSLFRRLVVRLEHVLRQFEQAIQKGGELTPPTS